jgi:hypothetical protein
MAGKNHVATEFAPFFFGQGDRVILLREEIGPNQVHVGGTESAEVVEVVFSIDHVDLGVGDGGAVQTPIKAVCVRAEGVVVVVGGDEQVGELFAKGADRRGPNVGGAKEEKDLGTVLEHEFVKGAVEAPEVRAQEETVFGAGEELSEAAEEGGPREGEDMVAERTEGVDPRGFVHRVGELAGEDDVEGQGGLLLRPSLRGLAFVCSIS